jgi:DNA-binding IclR family transcriptional regulator
MPAAIYESDDDMPSAKSDKTPKSEAKTSYIKRVFSLLRILADAGESGARLPQLADQLKIHRVNIHRLLNSLIELGYVEQSPDLSYHLGFEAWRLGQATLQLFVPSQISAAMDRIVEATGESVFLMRRSGDEGICVAARDGAVSFRSSSLGMSVGVRRFLGVGGTSVAILAEMEASEADTIIKNNTPEYRKIGLTARDVRAFVSETRERGHSFSPGVMLSEVRTVGVAIPRLPQTGAAQMAVSIVTLASRMEEARRFEFAAILRSEISKLFASGKFSSR